MEPLNLDDFEALARERLPAMAYDYYASGAHDEVTLRENRAAFGRLALRYRVLVDVSRRDAGTTVLGRRVAGLRSRIDDYDCPPARTIDASHACGPPGLNCGAAG